MHAASDAIASAAAPWTTLPAFLLGYALILATPGPNLLAVGAVAALRGLRGTLPLCLGIASGAGALALAVLSLAEAVAAVPALAGAGRVAGGAMLLGVAAVVLRAAPRGAADDGGRGPLRPAGAPGAAPAFLAGFATSASNPLTAAFFAAQGLGPLGRASGGGGEAALVPAAAVAAVALGFFLGVAYLLANPAVRRSVAARHRPIRRAAAAVLAALGVATLWPVAGDVAGAVLAGAAGLGTWGGAG